MGKRLLLIATSVLLLVTGCSLLPNRSSSNDSVSTVPTVLILDASGSMTENDAPGPRIDAAKAAAHQLIDALPDGAPIALQTYGTSTGSADSDKPLGCKDVTVLLPLGPLDRTAMGTAIDNIVPSGYTPIALALQTAANQLPADDSPQAIVLVSDGEDKCDIPPCETAAQLKQQRPGLTISTVGFKIDGQAIEQLRCIAETTGGIFVQAANADQLAARLLATQNINQANESLSSSGMFGVSLGETIESIRTKHPDFPTVDPRGTVLVVWQECDFGFIDGTLDGIRPHDGGRTIDGITVGTSITKAVELYGNPLSSTPNANLTTVIFDAGSNTDAAYRIDVDGYSQNGSTFTGTIKTITLCRCKPQASSKPTVTVDTVRNMTFPAGTCGNDSHGWKNTVPITVTNGDGEARTPSGEFGGASIRDASLVGSTDANGDGTEEAVVTFTCFGSTFDMCCAGRSSMMEFVGVYDFSDPASPRPVGQTIFPGRSPVRGETYGESRYIDQVRIDGSTIITEEKLIYADTSGATADLGHSPNATIEVTHRLTNGQWASTERVR